MDIHIDIIIIAAARIAVKRDFPFQSYAGLIALCAPSASEIRDPRRAFPRESTNRPRASLRA